MGNNKSKTISAAASSTAVQCSPSSSDYQGITRSPATSQLNAPSRPTIVRIESMLGDEGITRPSLRRHHVRGLSELIDPQSLARDDDYVKSPSGNLLACCDFSAREDRPLSLRERQERIRLQMYNNEAYAVSGISSAAGSNEPSPRSDHFPIHDIAEEQPEDALTRVKVESTKGRKQFCCF